MTVWTHIGNGPLFGITPNPTVAKHKQSMQGVKSVDLVYESLIEFGFNLKADEWTPDNITMAMLGQIATDTTGEYIKIGVGSVRRQIKFVGTNNRGPRYEVILPNCFINAKDALEFISESDETSPLPLSGDILYDATLGCFGTARALTGATGNAPITSPSVLNYYCGLGNIYTAPIA
jgi:hypothetical protein